MEAAPGDRLRSGAPLARLALVAFVLAWVFDVLGLRATVPIWLPFALALALELQFFVGARRAAVRRPDRLPQDVDLEFDPAIDDLLLVRRDGEEWWVPYDGQSEEEIDELIAEEREREALEAEEARAAGGSRSGRRPHVRRLLAGLAVIGALAALVWVVGGRGWDGVDADAQARAEARFSAEAARIAGHPVTVSCDDSGRHVGAVQHADGIAQVGGRQAYLAPDRCLDLYRLAFQGETSFSQTARSIAVLAHEAWHLQGVQDESVTECYALQSGVELGRRLGLSEGTARQMMRQQLAENALHTGSSAEYRVSGECRNGGELDLRPADPRFP